MGNYEQNLGEERVPTITALSRKYGNPATKKRLEEIMGDKANVFASSVLNAVSTNPKLRNCDAESIFNAALTAALMDFSINSSLGHVYIIPYAGYAQFQMGYKGFIQLAHRTEKYETIHAGVIYEGQIVDENPITGDIAISGQKKSDNIIGYVAYFKLLNGFHKAMYKPKEYIVRHGETYSKTYGMKDSIWTKEFDKMAMKTVIKALLKTWGYLSPDMMRAIKYDQAVIKGNIEDVETVDDLEAVYVDNPDSAEARKEAIKEMMQDGDRTEHP